MKMEINTQAIFLKALKPEGGVISTLMGYYMKESLKVEIFRVLVKCNGRMVTGIRVALEITT